MKNLLAIIADYYPHPSSNTNCFDPFLCGFEKDGWHIDVVTLKQWIELSSHETEENGRDIWRIDDPRSMNTILQNQLSNIPAPRFLKICNKLFATISKGLFFLKYCLLKPDKRYAGWSKPTTIAKCIELNKTKQYNLVISVSHPATSHEIAKGFLESITDGKKPHWILYEFDPYCYNEHIYGKNCYKKLASKQHILFDSADHICLTPELYDFYQATPFKEYKAKMISVPFPNMKPIYFDVKNETLLPLKNGRINCIFGGAFAINVRNPQYALDTFSCCSDSIRWNIITGFNLAPMLNKIKDNNSVISTYPSQSRDIAYDAMQKCDILVNIGNTVVFQAPGKIFEYMAMGKPIIHFQKIDNDPCLKYLKNYPLVLIINEQENNPLKHAQMIETFCKENKGKALTFEEVSKCIPQYISENVVNGFVKMANSLISEDKYAKK